MITLISLHGLCLLCLLLLSAFFSSAEVAYFSLTSLKVRELTRTSPSKAQRVEWILSSPTRLLSTLLIGNTLVNVAISAVTYFLIRTLFIEHTEEIAIASSLFFLIIFGEIGPKRIAVVYPEVLATRYAPLLHFFIYVFGPFRLILEQITQASSHLFLPKGRTLSDDEFSTVVDISGETGILDSEEHHMVKGIIRLENLQARDVMTPRVDVTALDLDDSQKNSTAILAQTYVRHVLLYRKQLDNVIGLLDVRHYFLDPELRIEQAWLPPFYVPEACPLDRLLDQFLREQKRTAIVVDEYGGTAGVITRGDILEEITGDIDDEQAVHELFFEKIGPDQWIMDGQISLEKLRDELEIDVEDKGATRISGWIMAKMERLPRPGDILETPPFKISIRKMRKNRIDLIEMIKLNEKP
ncbi:MAG: DUF21 domain-containing protein [Kiritimatiellae bacterium]|nr:DUF21 domain-containing protein [Kiritimatiellia bacterium]